MLWLRIELGLKLGLRVRDWIARRTHIDNMLKLVT